jgi:hypothetical protein
VPLHGDQIRRKRITARSNAPHQASPAFLAAMPASDNSKKRYSYKNTESKPLSWDEAAVPRVFLAVI